ncbi:hypothetical protein Cri9333_1732 [Crinalium epipsammum PCC 9333]|uniref:Uncharacterized protein n=1 Tax=Crinalium epipsammum PCC 9333 TaxID=1173022 RepID=K9VYP5_9CYAN|nr:hypothetical protein [Crinalium epipsammum]AFZ12617.1 hypothetical protein Cri9333_1732 [Crinalium epipsammum PCC 9333]
MKAKWLVITIVLVAILLAIVNNKKQSNNSASSTSEESSGFSPDESLAVLDTKQRPPDPRDVQRYTKVLDQLEGKCDESRKEIAAFAFSVTKSSQSAGFKTDNLDSLKSILSMTDGFERGRGSCYEIAKMFKETDKESKQQAGEDEAEQREEAEAQERQRLREQGGSQN